MILRPEFFEAKEERQKSRDLEVRWARRDRPGELEVRRSQGPYSGKSVPCPLAYPARLGLSKPAQAGEAIFRTSASHISSGACYSELFFAITLGENGHHDLRWPPLFHSVHKC